MRRAEGIVDVNVAEARKLSGKLVVVLLFFRMKAQVLKQQHVAVFESIDDSFNFRADAVIGKLHGLSQQFRQVRRHWAEAVFLIALALRSPQMRSQDYTRAPLGRILNRRQRSTYTRIILNHSVLERHVEIHTYKDPLALDVQVLD
jgi:hypothetical protein